MAATITEADSFRPDRDVARVSRKATCRRVGLCAACPVLVDRRAEGDRTESARWQTFGFRAGESPRERLDRRRAMRRIQPPLRFCKDQCYVDR
jgi:hypothetical protein